MLPNCKIIFGPPGTGKTTTLLNIVDECLNQGTTPEQIAFVSFSRKAAQEAMDRACKKFNLAEKRFLNFRTLHSIAFRQLNLKRGDIMRSSHYREFTRILGESFDPGKAATPEEPIFSSKRGNNLLQLCHMAKYTRKSLKEVMTLTDSRDIFLEDLVRFNTELENYKESRHLLEFIDFFDKPHKPLPVKVAIIDEAQDLTRQQWEFCFKIFKETEQTIVAGDDDQAVYDWAGADVDTFLSLPGEREVLQKSYRLPSTVYDMCQDIAKGIQKRQPKEWDPRDDLGLVQHEYRYEHVDISAGDWLILGRTNFLVKQVIDHLRSSGYVFEYNGKWSNDEPPFIAVRAYETLRKGKTVSRANALPILEYVKGLELPENKEEIEPDDLPLDYTLNWMQAFTEMPIADFDYVRSVAASSVEPTSGPGRIRLATIHAAKGGEATNVIVISDMSERVRKNYERNPDAELRVWYVACSRARQCLYICGKPNVILN